MLKRFPILLVAFLLTLLFVSPVEAAKPRVKGLSGRTATTSGYSTVRLSRLTNSVIITFINLTRVQKISYTLSYTANGIEQGVIGSLSPSGQSTESRDLYFGTCSKGVCTPHHNLTNVTLTVVTSTKTGAVTTKRYRIRI